MSTSRIIRVQVLVTIGLLLALVSSWFVTNPDQLGPFGITVWFVGLFVTLANLLSLLLYYLRRIGRKIKPGVATSLRQGILISLWLTSLLALNSLGQLSGRDVVLISLLVVLVEFYMRRGR